MSPRVLLSFAGAYADTARRLAEAFRSAGLAVVLDPWEGGGGVPARQRVPHGLRGIQWVVPMITPSDVAASWIDDTWQRDVLEPAQARGTPVLPVLGEGPLTAVPPVLRALSFADLRGRDAPHELRRLLRTMRGQPGGEGIVLPSEMVLALSSPMDEIDHPVLLELGSAWPRPAWPDDALALLVDGLFFELGVHVPPIDVRTVSELGDWGLRVSINQVPEYEAQVEADSVLVNESAASLARRGIFGVPASNPANGAPAAWVRHGALAHGVPPSDTIVWTPAEYLVLCLSAVLRRKAADLLAVSDVQLLLELAARAFPKLVAETVPDPVSPLVLTDVLRRLVVEGVGIRNLRVILTTLADRGRDELDPVVLTEYVRAGLSRQLFHTFGRGTGHLTVFLLDRSIEDQVRDALIHTPTGTYLDLAPQVMSGIHGAMHAAVDALPAGTQVPQILTTPDIRSAIRRVVAPSLPHLHVLSYAELRADINIQPVGRITLQGFEPRPGVFVGGEPVSAQRSDARHT